MADLPHILYSKKKPTQEQEENRMIVSRDMNEQIKKKGLTGALGVSFNLK